MKHLRRRAMLQACALAVLAPSVVAGESLTLGQKAGLQAAMQAHIERGMVGGAYLRLNETTGEVRKLRPMAAHPIMLRMGEYFVLCSDFRDSSGDNVNIDFYLAAKGGGYVVFGEQVDNRNLIERLMKAGKADRIG